MKDGGLGRKHFILATLVPLIIAIDQWTKTAITNRFRLYESTDIITGYFSLTYIRNTGAAFGILAESHPEFRIPFFLLVPTLALLVIGYLFRKLPRDSVLVSSALSLIIAGAVGNLIDRVRFGYVIDFLDFHWKYQSHFPAFNVADSAICIGVGILLLDMRGPAKEHASHPA